MSRLNKHSPLHSVIGRISQFRRRRFTGALLLLVSLLFTGAAYAAIAPSANADNGTSAADQIAQGKALFLVSCSFCHGQNGEGVTTTDGKNIGPSLVGTGAAAADFQVRTGRMPLQQSGPQGAYHKRVVFSDTEIKALAAYVASFGAGPAIPSDAAVNAENSWSTDQKDAMIQLGGKVFLTNCTACHNFTGAGGAMPNGAIAPNILNDDTRTIMEALLTGPGPMPNFSDGNLSLKEKQAVAAFVHAQRDQTNYGGSDLLSAGPVAEGLMAWTIGIGSMVGFAIWIAAHTTRTNKKKDA
ncbi:cystathionine beta-lyase [Nocardioides baekrokdamisoli]|uniref:Cytochrome bc1 complex cytochrome c subunit n=1 Tax=Nocardioides baekrokdamisoli TaxID=1804624 RepID=A0A3G9IJD4_9ACTN|nr:c-type cytochrome [Nocardioides baekrokdamisoli]BBH18282.1 cystathionine beta-lyase [Nocardioides baekrokdamisoli]